MASIKYENVRDYIPSEMISDVNNISAEKITQFLDKLEDEVDSHLLTRSRNE